MLLVAPAAAAEGGVAYEPGAGGDLLKNLAGAAYLLLVAIFIARLLRKRAKTSLSQRWASMGKQSAADEGAQAQQRPPVKATPLTALWGAVQAGAMAYGMWLVSTGVDAYFDRQAMPGQYTVRNITVTIRTVTRGLAYLATFIFGANAIGLSALSVQLLVRPDAVEEEVDVSENARSDGASNDAGGC
ncbi:hypothetical protein WJX81_006625 [Elliptochloris bilobata]|uniref:DUF1206 domain-containing protein n=1 Tax=Elliptochloris bilobata TaxID=381761 RepID=A0AAW1QV96_9CHLO